MADYVALKRKVDELAAREWDENAIKARINKMSRNGISRRKPDAKKMLADKQRILDHVQLLAEENNFYLKNCAQATALALMEEFGMGNMEIIKALTPFPGIAGSGKICGGISGSLIAFGLFFGPDEPPDFVKMNNTILIAQKFLESFEKNIGYQYCSDIIEKVTIGYKLNPGESDAAMMKFAGEKGFEKCGLPPGLGARIAAGLMIDSMR